MRKIKKVIIFVIALALLLLGCSAKPTDNVQNNTQTSQEDTKKVQDTKDVQDLQEVQELQDTQEVQDIPALPVGGNEEEIILTNPVFLDSEKDYYLLSDSDKYRTTYELFVYSFYDSDGDGIGDLNGVREKLDYLNDGDFSTNEDLGVTGLWLMPIMDSPTYHKYDVRDYYSIDPEYGTMEDFEGLLSECKKRNISVIIDLPINHTSIEHEWFAAASDYLKQLKDNQEPNLEECPYIDYYNFSKEKGSGYAELTGTDWYYEAVFWEGMPDLNLQSEGLRNELESIFEFWLKKGVKGFRLDGVKEYVGGSREANIEILTWINDSVKKINKNAYLVGEGWLEQNEYEKYYASGIDSMFDFAFADKDGYISKTLNGLIEAKILGRAFVNEEASYSKYNENYINAPFYTNHDMGRSAGYYSGDYSECQTKMAGAVNLFMSGNVFLYYGEEIGMKGSGKDENKRLAMNWSDESDYAGMCKGPIDAEVVKQKYDSVDKQLADESSILSYYKKCIRLRNQYPAIAKGKTTDVKSDGSVLWLQKEYIDDKGVKESVTLIFNLSEKEYEFEAGELGEMTIEAAITTNGEVEIADKVTMPGYSIILGLMQ